MVTTVRGLSLIGQDSDLSPVPKARFEARPEAKPAQWFTAALRNCDNVLKLQIGRPKPISTKGFKYLAPETSI